MLLVLALVWGAFLVWWLRSRAQGTFGDSIGTFRRHLHVLERAAPTTVRPANRLRGPQMVPAYRPPAGTQGPPSRRVGHPQARRPVTGGDTRRRQSLKRRRDVLFLLAIAIIATLAMAAATRSHALIAVQVVADAAMVGYIALLVRLRTLAAERDIKLTYLPRERSGRMSAHDTTGEIPGPGYAAARRRQTPRRPAYEYGSYGDLAMRRAAN